VLGRVIQNGVTHFDKAITGVAMAVIIAALCSSPRPPRATGMTPDVGNA
jgi:hypothetical protein